MTELKEYEVRGLSMAGVVEPGDTIKLLITKDIKKNDLVIFRETMDLQQVADIPVSIKMCQGISGDKITVNSDTGEMWVNGKLMPVKLNNDAQKFCWKDWLKFSSNVPEGYLFLLGTDAEAIDSRSRGYFSLEQILGKAFKASSAASK